MNNNFTLIVLPDKGTGVFANKEYTPNEVLGEFLQNTPSRLGSKVKGVEGLWESDTLGRFCNHSANPNTYLDKTEPGYLLYAKSTIDIGDEITVNYCMVDDKLGLPLGITIYPIFIEMNYKEYGKSICEY